MSFGKNLERIRKEKKVSQAKLGSALDITQQMISSYEKDMSSPSIDTLVKIADFFNVSVDNLVGHVVKDPEPNSAQVRLQQYFQNLTEVDKERCITIIQAIVEDRELNR